MIGAQLLRAAAKLMPLQLLEQTLEFVDLGRRRAQQLPQRRCIFRQIVEIKRHRRDAAKTRRAAANDAFVSRSF